MAAMAMFPLGTVLLPGAYLPLHVFEPRYQALVHDCLAGTPEFGVALIERGHEVGGGDSRFEVGCVARILDAREVTSGRWILSTIGVRRIRVERWLADDPYPIADVADWADPAPEPTLAARVEEVAADLRRVLALAVELGAGVPSAAFELVDDVIGASYQLASLLPVGPLDRLNTLRAPSVGDRLEVVADLIVDLEVLLASRLDRG